MISDGWNRELHIIIYWNPLFQQHLRVKILPYKAMF
jgi:hypothetical protein